MKKNIETTTGIILYIVARANRHGTGRREQYERRCYWHCDRVNARKGDRPGQYVNLILSLLPQTPATNSGNFQNGPQASTAKGPLSLNYKLLHPELLRAKSPGTFRKTLYKVSPFFSTKAFTPWEAFAVRVFPYWAR